MKTKIKPANRKQKQLAAILEKGKDWQSAIDLIREMKPLELVAIDFLYPENKWDLPYLIAVADEHLMFETCYLWSSTGKPPYSDAIEFGLSESDIEQYQEMWRSIGVDPLEVEIERMSDPLDSGEFVEPERG